MQMSHSGVDTFVIDWHKIVTDQSFPNNAVIKECWVCIVLGAFNVKIL